MSSNSKNLAHHNRYSISPDLERRFGQSRNFTLSPETTDCESNFGEADSDVSSLMLVMDPDVNPPGNGPVDRLYPSMPVLEDGLSSGHTSDNENNNPTVSNFQVLTCLSVSFLMEIVNYEVLDHQ